MAVTSNIRGPADTNELWRIWRALKVLEAKVSSLEASTGISQTIYVIGPSDETLQLSITNGRITAVETIT